MDPTVDEGGPGWAWGAAAVLAVAVGWAVYLGLEGRASQLLWAWGIDGGYFMQRIWQGAHAPFAERTLFWNESGAGTFGGRHHSPIVGLFVPALAARPAFTTLLAVQAGVLGAGVLPLFALAWRCVGHRAAALALTVAAVSVPGFLAIGVADFRLLAPSMVLVPATVLAAVFGPWPAAFAAAVLTCSVREELAPLLLALTPLLVWERAHRAGGSWRDHLGVPLLAVALPAGLWVLGTAWRTEQLMEGQAFGLEVGSGPPAEAPAELLRMLVADARGELVDPPAMVLRLLGVGGLASALLLLRPLAVAAPALFWIGACVHAGVVNPGQVHYWAPLVGVYVALVPLALGRHGRPRRALIGAAALVVAHALLPPGPVSVREAWSFASLQRAEEWALAERIRPEDVVLATGWLLPTVAPRQEIYATDDLRGDRGRTYDRADVAFVMTSDSVLDELPGAGFVEVARTGNAVLLRKRGP